MTHNSDKQLPKKLLTMRWNNKRRVGGVLHSNKKTLVQNIAHIVPTVDRHGSLNIWAHLDLDNKYWKYLIDGIVNATTPLPGPPTSPTNKKAHPPSLPSPLCTCQDPPTSSKRMQGKDHQQHHHHGRHQPSHDIEHWDNIQKVKGKQEDIRWLYSYLQGGLLRDR